MDIKTTAEVLTEETARINNLIEGAVRAGKKKVKWKLNSRVFPAIMYYLKKKGYRISTTFRKIKNGGRVTYWINW